MPDAPAIDTDNAVEAQDAPQNPLVALVSQGQSIWLDYITRDLVHDGTLKRLIEADGLRGMTSNPTIFQKAIAEGHAYDDQLEQLVDAGKDAREIFTVLAITDIQDACDLFRPVYDKTDGLDGYVSIEVSPAVAHDAAATLSEARHLWASVDRPNVMIKVPGTDEAMPAIKQLLRDGINVNVTLLFALRKHAQVMSAYIGALEERVLSDHPVDRVASVASFFVSRVDTLIDTRLDERATANDGDQAAVQRFYNLRGTAAIANARLAYAQFRACFDSERFRRLQSRGARVQRPLWASTSTKNPALRDVLYVESLIGPDTVNTVPMATIRAFQDHGVVRRTIDTGIDEARATMAAPAALGIDYDAVTRTLEHDGLASFAASYDDLITGVEEKRQRLRRLSDGPR
jgi:transaldolase